MNCPRCQMFRREVPLSVGHCCTDSDPCERCQGPRMVHVVLIDKRGSLSVRQPCEGCARTLALQLQDAAEVRA